MFDFMKTDEELQKEYIQLEEYKKSCAKASNLGLLEAFSNMVNIPYKKMFEQEAFTILRDEILKRMKSGDGS